MVGEESDQKLCDYEIQRLEKMERNNAVLESLGITNAVQQVRDSVSATEATNPSRMRNTSATAAPRPPLRRNPVRGVRLITTELLSSMLSSSQVPFSEWTVRRCFAGKWYPGVVKEHNPIGSISGYDESTWAIRYTDSDEEDVTRDELCDRLTKAAKVMITSAALSPALPPGICDDQDSEIGSGHGDGEDDDYGTNNSATDTDDTDDSENVTARCLVAPPVVAPSVIVQCGDGDTGKVTASHTPVPTMRAILDGTFKEITQDPESLGQPREDVTASCLVAPTEVAPSEAVQTMQAILDDTFKEITQDQASLDRLHEDITAGYLAIGIETPADLSKEEQRKSRYGGRIVCITSPTRIGVGQPTVDWLSRPYGLDLAKLYDFDPTDCTMATSIISKPLQFNELAHGCLQGRLAEMPGSKLVSYTVPIDCGTLTKDWYGTETTKIFRKTLGRATDQAYRVFGCHTSHQGKS